MPVITTHLQIPPLPLSFSQGLTSATFHRLCLMTYMRLSRQVHFFFTFDRHYVKRIRDSSILLFLKADKHVSQWGEQKADLLISFGEQVGGVMKKY